MKKFIPTLLTSLMILSCGQLQASDDAKTNTIADSPKNIIMIIGDGMGPAYTSAYRYFHDDPNTPEIEQTVFDRHFVGNSSTYPAAESGYITDSAASATALSTGIKSYNGAIGVNVNKQPVETVLEYAKQSGKKTGVVLTLQINHATPAAYLAHNVHRYNYNAIADSYIDDGIKADLYFGGGWKYFIREDRNIVDEFIQSGFHYIDKYSEISSIPANKPVLGLFDKTGLPWALDDTNKYRLSMMTQAATKQLENDNGFFMLIEGSRIDYGGHARDIAAAMHEMDDLAKTLEYLETYVKEHPDTLVVITADHSTGGLSIGKKTERSNANINSKYLWKPEFLRSMTMSPETIAKRFMDKELSLTQLGELLSFNITATDMENLQQAKLADHLIVKQFKLLAADVKKSKRKPKPYQSVLNVITKIIDVKTNTGWGSISPSGTHTGIDVPVFAFGKGSEIFSGFQDNTDIAKKIFTLLGKK
ncbi:alkaline phosphatase [Colwellia sp. MB3u-70]|uniref:alkaline phosphatase n=1 Tax=unclassified Colwellia TaxID=196834 RepID=UPI0015F72ED1|nr:MULTISPECIES: alkaline phosphatase [unclassified Colwellia]MBA6291152.1 alkaline phosphatase [Colwellia sp. MB3u-8]MBA6305876.1 alkaline phosphatase [Colwellia sp. MB3u-70]